MLRFCQFRLEAEGLSFRYYTNPVNMSNFDITKPQPQLFVTPNFQNLTQVLEKFADTMAFRKGGSESILKAIECKNTCTAVYSSGLQISGVFSDLRMDNTDELLFLKNLINVYFQIILNFMLGLIGKMV